MRLGNPKLAVDSQAEEDGLWVDCPTIWWPSPDRPMRGKVRSKASKRHQSLLRKLTKGLSQEELEQRAEDIAIELSAALLADWQEWLDESGAPLPYSEEMALAVLRNRENRDMLNWVNQAADDTQRFYYHNRENSEKNC